MIIIGHMLNFEGAHADVFEVFIQIGAILAIYTHYRRTFNSFLKRKNWIKTRWRISITYWGQVCYLY